MKIRIVYLVIVCCMTAALALPAAAQQMPAPGPRGATPSDEKREEVRKKMQSIRIARLTEELKLSEETAAKFIPIITMLDKNRRELMRENHKIMKEIRSALKDPKPDEHKLKASMDKFEKNHQDMKALQDKEIDAARANLTVEQQARYLIFHQDFQHEMRGMMEGARDGSGPGRHQGRDREDRQSRSGPPENP